MAEVLTPGGGAENREASSGSGGSGGETPIRPRHFGWQIGDRVAVITLDRPERRNPLTFESYRERADTFHALRRPRHAELVRAGVLTGAGGPVTPGRHAPHRIP